MQNLDFLSRDELDRRYPDLNCMGYETRDMVLRGGAKIVGAFDDMLFMGYALFKHVGDAQRFAAAIEWYAPTIFDQHFNPADHEAFGIDTYYYRVEVEVQMDYASSKAQRIARDIYDRYMAARRATLLERINVRLHRNYTSAFSN